MNINQRISALLILRKHYSEFIPFLVDVMNFLGFTATDIQKDIARYIAYGPEDSMVQAQRGQSKTTIAVAYSTWTLIHNPKARILIMSAGERQANEISTLIVKLIVNWDILECLRPDVSRGDRSSVEHFDVHYTLKGVDKSPSVACMGIKSNLQGARADLLIADDIESYKNSNTQRLREELLHITRDFASIVTSGKILWLGTPQSDQSIYNSLPGRGTHIRIWPGRYPTQEQLANYGNRLAPSISAALLNDPSLCSGGGMLGDQGQAIEGANSDYLGEAVLQKKEESQGPAYFQLQHMLNTALLDAARTPLKLSKLVLLDFNRAIPARITPGMGRSAMQSFSRHVSDAFSMALNVPHELGAHTIDVGETVAYIDPAGGGANADETGYAIVANAGSTLGLVDIGGVAGGYDLHILEDLAKRIAEHRPNKVIIEKNMGYGAFREVFVPILLKELQVTVEDDYVTGQKELRIISTLEPILGRQSLLIHPRCIDSDARDCARYPSRDRLSYSFFYQLSTVTRDRGSLVHDDRLDAVEGACRYFQKQLEISQDMLAQQIAADEWRKQLANPLGKKIHQPPKRPNMVRRYR